MATECINKLILNPSFTYYGDEAPTKQLKQFVAKSLGGFLELHKIEFPLLGNTYPIPSSVSESDTWDWAEEHWGTGEEVQDAGYDDLSLEDNLLLFFESRDTPPLKWLKKMSADYPLLWFSLQYRILNGDEIGTAVANNGKLKHVKIDYGIDF